MHRLEPRGNRPHLAVPGVVSALTAQVTTAEGARRRSVRRLFASQEFSSHGQPQSRSRGGARPDPGRRCGVFGGGQGLAGGRRPGRSGAADAEGPAGAAGGPGAGARPARASGGAGPGGPRRAAALRRQAQVQPFGAPGRAEWAAGGPGARRAAGGAAEGRRSLPVRPWRRGAAGLPRGGGGLRSGAGRQRRGGRVRRRRCAPDPSRAGPGGHLRHRPRRRPR